jgi:thymidylate synthase (FAD)
MKNVHTTPSEMPSIWFHMQMPVFVARQSERHRTAKIFEGIEEYCDPSINEVSGRYVQLPAEWYIPEVVGGKSTSGAKQGQEDNLDTHCQKEFKYHLNEQCYKSYELYTTALGNGVAPEHARMFLHLNHYTHWLWKQDLHNLMHFLSLRLHSHAQIEARQYAEAIYKLLSYYLPETMKLFDKHRRM